ncbi:hypothetical protein Tco_1555899 [Tanacetum coccineum]
MDVTVISNPDSGNHCKIDLGTNYTWSTAFHFLNDGKSDRILNTRDMLPRLVFIRFGKGMDNIYHCLYCLGKDNRENIMKSINEGPFHMGTVSDVIASGTKGAVQQGPVRPRVLNDLSLKKRKGIKADIRATISFFKEVETEEALLNLVQSDFRFRYFKDKMLTNASTRRNGAVLDEEQSLFLDRENWLQNFDEDVDKFTENDWHSMWTISLRSC